VPVVHPVVGVRVVSLFVADFLDQPGESRAGKFTHINFLEFGGRLRRLFDFGLYHLVQSIHLQ
jgi:hypothetical protein